MLSYMILPVLLIYFIGELLSIELFRCRILCYSPSILFTELVCCIYEVTDYRVALFLKSGYGAVKPFSATLTIVAKLL